MDGNEIHQRMETSDRERGTNLIEKYFVEPARWKRVPKCLTSYAPAGPEIGLIGRDKIVEDVRLMLDSKKSVALVSGLGGIGKTAVMQRVCHNIMRDEDSSHHAAWITCGDSFEKDMLLLRDTLGIPKDLNEREHILKVIHCRT